MRTHKKKKKTILTFSLRKDINVILIPLKLDFPLFPIVYYLSLWFRYTTDLLHLKRHLKYLNK